MGCSATERQPETAKGSINSYNDFYAAIAHGAALVVVDDWVIDVRRFLEIHPGGPETLQQLVGTYASSERPRD
jgi:cytochrome b involved in lipid metabolism